MTRGLGAICFACRYRRGGGTCDAYPGGIPTEIFYGGFDHRRPFGGERREGGMPILSNWIPRERETLRLMRG